MALGPLGQVHISVTDVDRSVVALTGSMTVTDVLSVFAGTSYVVRPVPDQRGVDRS